ncbi:MAG: hypothetical protein U0414_44530, partial [Polyangiaceae bacterium]
MPTPSASLADIEAAGQLANFVGRRSEILQLCRAIERGAPTLFYVFGPGGVGKTCLARAFAAKARDLALAVAHVDARRIEPTLPAVRAALERAGLRRRRAVRRSRPGVRRMVSIDTFEALSAIESFVLPEVLERVDCGTIVVVSSRDAPSARWRALSTWGRSIVPIALRNLLPAESVRYLSRRGITGERAAAIVAFSHGHPLALALAADAVSNAPSLPFVADPSRETVSALYDYFMRGVADPRRREAIEACAILHVTTEVELRHTLERSPGDSFAWLRQLSFIETHRRGLFPHDLAREVILAELRWRNPGRVAMLALRVQARLAARLRDLSGPELMDALDDFTFVVGHNPKLRMMMVQPEGGELVPDDLRDGDAAHLERIARLHEGDASAAQLSDRLRRAPSCFRVVRGRQGEVVAFGAYLRLDMLTPADRAADPETARVFEHASALVGAGPLPPTLFARWLLDASTGHSPTPALGVCVHLGTRLLFSERIALSYIRHSDSMAWRDLVAMSGARFLPELEGDAEGRRYETTLMDLRDVSPFDWLMRLDARTAAEGWGVATRTARSDAPKTALAKADFAMRVRDALRALEEPLLLVKSPLLYATVARGVARADRVAALRRALLDAIVCLGGSPRGDVLRGVLEAAYVGKPRKHEAAALDLGM